MSEVKIKAVTNITSQGVAMEFEGLKAFNQQWFSWENIASKMLGVSVEAAQFDPSEKYADEKKNLGLEVDRLTEIADGCRSDASRNGDVLIKIQDLIRNWTEGR